MAAQLSVRPPWVRTLESNPYETNRETLVRSVKLRKNLEESRKAFLNIIEDVEKPQNEKRNQAKKISFKIKKTSSVYRRKDKIGTAISANKVQELAKKYNELVERSTLAEQPKIARLVKRVSMRKNEEIPRKPSVKKRESIARKVSVKKSEPNRIRTKSADSKVEIGGGVKAAIAIFEQKSVETTPAPKPKVPEKTFDSRNVALKNHEKRLKIFEKRLKLNNNNESNNNKNEQSEEKTDAADLIVQVVNIPLAPPKKCDSKYETMQLKKTIETKDSNNQLEKSRRTRKQEHYRSKTNEETDYKLAKIEEGKTKEANCEKLEEPTEENNHKRTKREKSDRQPTTESPVPRSVDQTSDYKRTKREETDYKPAQSKEIAPKPTKREEIYCKLTTAKMSTRENPTESEEINYKSVPKLEETDCKSKEPNESDYKLTIREEIDCEITRSNGIEYILTKREEIDCKPTTAADWEELYDFVDVSATRKTESENQYQPPVPPRRPGLLKLRREGKICDDPKLSPLKKEEIYDHLELSQSEKEENPRLTQQRKPKIYEALRNGEKIHEDLKRSKLRSEKIYEDLRNEEKIYEDPKLSKMRSEKIYEDRRFSQKEESGKIYEDSELSPMRRDDRRFSLKEENEKIYEDTELSPRRRFSLKEEKAKIYEDPELSKPRREEERIAEEKIYEELKINYEDPDEDDGYEICESPVREENIYETLPSPVKVPPLLPRRREEPLPPRPPSRNSYVSESNFYESIYSKREDDVESTYESIYGCKIDIDEWKSKRDSLISDQQSNSIYNRSITSWAEDVFNYVGKNGSELSGSDRSDDWVDLSDNEERIKNSGFIILKERQKVGKRVSGWSQQMRDQWNKIPRNRTLDQGDSDSDHHYETLSSAQNPSPEVQDDEFDSFDSDSESDNSFAKNDSGVDMGNTQLPEPPNQQTYVHRLAATAGKHMKKWRNWSLTKNDITKTLGRMTKRKSRTDLDGIDKISEEKSQPSQPPLSLPPDYESPENQDAKRRDSTAYQNVQFTSQENQAEPTEKTKSLGRKGFLNKFRRSMSISGDTPELSLSSDHKAKSTFYLTETIDVDPREEKDEVPVVNLTIKSKTSPVRPRVPPPPTPKQSSPTLDIRKKGNSKRSTSWYSECGVFKNAEPPPILPRRPNTFWYAEVGLYRSSTSTPSTSSTENSGSLTNVIIKPPDIQEDTDDYYNVKNENDYYNGSIQSSDSCDTKKDEAFNSLSGDLQLRLQDEPLYQFYDAAVLESVCKDGTSDFEYDGYEEVGKKNLEIRLTARPTAMELVAPKRNNISVARTLWCEIPEVIQSAVLSTLSLHQKKLQEAKFEMLTSEASYLNSLNVLTDHFEKKLHTCDFLSDEEKEIMFGKILPVKECSEKLLLELEKCWQENILLHGICEIVKKHAEENFYVYVTYCENQILLDRTLRKLKERHGFIEALKELESSSVCHLLTLHSFLMLPMQRVTRWPLLLDAVLKRLSHQDEEYLSCQYALATLNKIVNQCNEGARRMERVTEMQKISSQMEFGKGVIPIPLVTGSRWLVRSGPLIQMQARGDDIKLTFGKRFTKVPLHLFLFNDILIVAKSRGDENYLIQHYCYRSYLEINSETLSCLPLKDTQGRHLIFLTILENHDEKTIELLLSCNSETDKERWLEALSPPKSENPDETLYECWDCPQVTAVHTYPANQPDELPLSRGDIINVTRKMADGWFHGERIRDGETGWFPANYTVEVANPHVRARNLKQRYRLLAFSESYLKSK